MTDPVLIVLPSHGVLTRLKNLCEESGIYDAEILLAQAIDCMVSPTFISEELQLLGERVIDADSSLCQARPADIDAVDVTTRQRISNTLSELTTSAADQLSQHELYSGSFFHYEFARIGDDDNIILQRVK